MTAANEDETLSPTVEVEVTGVGRCVATDLGSGVRIATQAARVGGLDRSAPSSTDLVAAALGTCIGSTIEAVASRHGVDLSGIRITVAKTMSTRPDRIGALDVLIAVPAGVDERVRLMMERAGRSCTVHRSLHPDVAVTLTVIER
jgi:putative redox protein